MNPPRRLPALLPLGVVLETRETDVAVLGGGPAGSAVALALTDAGRSVVVLERSRYESVRIGEALPPEVKVPLSLLGVWDRFLADGPLPSPGIVSVWGAPLPRDNDSIINPFGSGWHIDRRRFDVMLARAAEARGAEVLCSARVRSWNRGPSGVWLLQILAADRAVELRAHVLVDATGRASSPVRRLAGGRVVYDRLGGLIEFVEAGPRDDHRTLVEAVEDGWWYSALLPQGRVVAAFMTDADLIPRGSASRTGFWRAQLRKAHHTCARLGARTPGPVPKVVVANSSLLRCVAGDGRVAVGDAAATLDPLSGQGVYRALGAGLAAARAIDAHLRGDPEALRAYSRQVASDFAADRALGSEHYGRERRWAGAPVWARRQGTVGAVLPGGRVRPR